MANVRYLVNDVGVAIEFYRDLLGFKLEQQFGPAMAILEKDGLSLWLAGPASSAAKPMLDGAKPQSGGWARIVLTVEDLSGLVASLRKKNVKFRNEILQGPGGAQILCEDPSGNCVELFQP